MERHRQRGASLVEAMVAFLVLSLGMLGLARLHTHMQRHADLARQTSEAMRLAQEAMEGLRAMPAEAQPKEEIAEDAGAGMSSNTVYRLQREVDRQDGDRYSSARVEVTWSDRSGEVRRVQLHSAMARVPDVLSGALAVQSHRERLTRVEARAPSVPRTAHPLGDGRSVLKPAGSTVALVFEDVTGQVASICSGLNASVSSEQVSVEMLSHCQAVHAHLLSGWVRFATGTADTLTLSVAVDLTREATPTSTPCVIETHADGVAYHCAIATAGPWSGRSRIVPQGWTLGEAFGQYRVCRYSADTDGSGAVDRPAEHPEHYREVDTSLIQQNFLVIPGDRKCADAGPATTPHQP